MDNPSNNIDSGGGDVSATNSSNSNSANVDGGATAAAAAAAAAGGGGSKGRSPLDKLSKEELLIKCRHLITIAQKAKTAKDDAVGELQKQQAKAVSENDALMEMVNNLTESKVALITKSESLQRQLNLSSTELETVQACQGQILESRQEAQDKVHHYEDKIQRIREHVQTETDKHNKLIEEHSLLQERVENLEAQTSQLDILKSNCKKLLEEKNKLEEFSIQAKALIAEKKANDIILQESKNQKKKLDESVKKLTSDIKVFEAKNTEMESNMKAQERQFEELNGVRENGVLTKEQDNESEKLVAELRTKCDGLEDLVNKLQEDLKMKENSLSRVGVECSLDQTDNSPVNASAEMEQLRSMILELESAAEVQKSCTSQELEQERIKNEDLAERLIKTGENSEEEKNNLEQMLFDANEKYSQYESEIQGMKEQYSRKDAEINSIRDIHNFLENEMSVLKEELTSQKKELTSQKEACEKLQTEYSSTNELNGQLCKDLDEIKMKFVESEKRNESYSVLSEESQKCIDDLGRQLDASKQKLEELSTAADLEVKQSADKDTLVKQFQDKISESERQLKQSHETIAELQETSKSLEEKLLQLEVQINEHVKKIDDVTADFARSLIIDENNYSGLNSILSSENINNGNVKSNESAVNRLNTVLSMLDNYCVSSKESSVQFSQEKDKMTCQLKSITDEKADLLKQLDDERGSYDSKLNTLNNDFEALQKSYDNVKEENSSILSKETSDCEVSENQKKRLEEQLEVLRESVNKTCQENNELNAKVAEIENSERKLSNDLSESEKKVDELTRLLEERSNELSAKISGMEASDLKLNDSTNKQEELEKLDNHLEEVKTLNDNLKSSLEFANEALQTVREEQSAVQSDLQTRLDVLMKEDESNKVLISNFHAAESELKNTIMELEKENVQYKTLNTSLEESMSQSSVDRVGLNEQLKELSVNAGKISQLEAELAELKQHESEHLNSVVEKEAKLDELQLQLKDVDARYEQELSTKSKELEDIRDQLRNAKEEKEKYNSRLGGVGEELSVFRSEKELIHREMIQLKKTKVAVESQLDKTLNEKEDVMQEISTLKQENSHQSDRITEVEKENTELNEQLSRVDMQGDEKIVALKKDKDDLNESLKNADAENLQMKEKLQEFGNEIDKRLAENKFLQVELSETVAKKQVTDSKIQGIQGKFNELSFERDDLIKRKKELVNSNEELETSNAELLKNKEELSITSKSCLKELAAKSEECKQLEEELHELKGEHQDCRLQLQQQQQLLLQLSSNRVQLQQQLSVSCSRSETAELSLQQQQLTARDEEAQRSVATARCQELLAELNEVTGVLRDRGERISRLEATLKQRNDEHDRLSSQMAQLRNQVSRLEKEKEAVECQLGSVRLQLSGEQNSAATVAEITSREAALVNRIDSLEKTVQALNHEKEELLKCENSTPGTGSKGLTSSASSSSINAASCDNHSEVMSNSSYSKAEDVHRLKDLEDTFEERYMKLKSVAIKLKKKLAEQTIQLNAAEEQKNKLLAQKEQFGPAKAASKNIQILQGEIDRLQDSVEGSNRGIKELNTQLATAAQQLAEAKDQLAEQLQQIDTLNSSVKSLEELTGTQQTNETELQAKILTLQAQASGLEEEDTKQRSLLNLELLDSERSIAELRAQMSEMESESCREKQELAGLRQRIVSLDTQLEHLTAQHSADDSTTEHLRKSNEELRSQLTDVEKEVLSMRMLKQQHTVEIERLLQEVEAQKVCVTDVSQAKAQAEDHARRTAARNNKQVAALEEGLESITKELQQTSDELQQLKKNFEGYKARAQSVLKQQQQQQQTSGGVDAGELQRRLQLAETQLQSIQQTNRLLQSELSGVQSEHKFAQSEKERTRKHHKLDCEQAAAEQATLHEQIGKLEKKLHQVTTDTQAVIAKMAAEGEAMANSYEGQLKNSNVAHQRELMELQCQLDAANRKLQDANSNVSNSAGLAGSKTANPRQRLNSTEDPRVDVTTMVREAGEGSEWVEPAPTHRHQQQPSTGSNSSGGARPSSSLHHELHKDPYNPPSLQQLINSTGTADDNGSNSSSITEIVSNANALYANSQIASLQKKVDAYELRITQVSSLLHESEAENDKLAQLTSALKEEIRRGSRNNDREKHLENLEYLKNVVLQFITLGVTGGDGRERLLPVLSTLLQLSPVEVTKIKSTIKGEGDASAGSAGWGSYLHMWSGR